MKNMVQDQLALSQPPPGSLKKVVTSKQSGLQISFPVLQHAQ